MVLYKLLFLNVFFCFLCVGCVSRPFDPVQVGDFELRGKLAVKDAGDNFTARFLWRQEGDQFRIDLWGPLGQGRVQLVGSHAHIALLDGKGRIVTQGPQASVMRAQLGWSMPLDVLPAWVQGTPKAGIPSDDLELAEGGLVRSFRQLDWLVTYGPFQRVESVREVRSLPRRITVENAATRVRLVISEWRI